VSVRNPRPNGRGEDVNHCLEAQEGKRDGFYFLFYLFVFFISSKFSNILTAWIIFILFQLVLMLRKLAKVLLIYHPEYFEFDIELNQCLSIEKEMRDYKKEIQK
jgi:hypothetical protein